MPSVSASVRPSDGDTLAAPQPQPSHNASSEVWRERFDKSHFCTSQNKLSFRARDGKREPVWSRGTSSDWILSFKSRFLFYAYSVFNRVFSGDHAVEPVLQVLLCNFFSDGRRLWRCDVFHLLHLHLLRFFTLCRSKEDMMGEDYEMVLSSDFDSHFKCHFLCNLNYISDHFARKINFFANCFLDN